MVLENIMVFDSVRQIGVDIDYIMINGELKIIYVDNLSEGDVKC